MRSKVSGNRDHRDREEASGSASQAMWTGEVRPRSQDLDCLHPVERESTAARRFRLVTEAAPNAIVMVNRAGQIVLVNAQAERVFEYSRTELLGQPIEMLVPERFRSGHAAMCAGFFAEPRPRPMGAGRDLFGRKKDGSEFPVEIGLNPIETDEGLMVLAGVVDITERKAAERALRETEQRARSLAAIVESSDDAIVSTALDGVVTSWNKAAERIFGYTAEEMIGQSILRLAVPGHRGDMIEILDRMKRGERIHHYETTRRHKNGVILHISLGVSPIIDAGGRLIGASKVSRDITATKNAEMALRQSEARLQEMHAELLHVSRLSAMGQVVAALAHELNQPLTAISNYMEAARVLLDRGADVPLSRIGSAIDRVGEQAVRAAQIIQRLRGFLSRGNDERRIEPVSTLVKEAVELAQLDMRQRGVSIRLGNVPADVSILADKIEIQQVLLNLLRNAAEAVADQESREIALLTEANATTLQISVVDNGPGLPDEVRDKLFQPFVSTKKTGMGVGLSICHTIVTAHDGHLSAEPNPDGGTIFKFTLPIVSARF
jgi:two-component system, LuxR family, sensor kinase FixL